MKICYRTDVPVSLARQRFDAVSYTHLDVYKRQVSGKRAFKRDTAAETMTAILKEDPPELNELVLSLIHILIGAATRAPGHAASSESRARRVSRTISCSFFMKATLIRCHLHLTAINSDIKN